MTKEYDDSVGQLASILRTSASVTPTDDEGKTATESLATQLEVSHATSTGMRWGWSADPNPDTWVGSFFTREQAIEDARSYSWKTFYVVSGKCPDGKRYMPTAEIIESMLAEAATDAAGEAAEDFPGLSSAALDEMNQFFQSWSKKHLGMCAFWIADSEPEKVEEGTA